MSEEVARLCPRCHKEWIISGEHTVHCNCGKMFCFDDSLVPGGCDDNGRTIFQYAQTDIINHPEHYAGSIECIDAMIAAYGEEQVAIFCKLCAFKYLWRLEKKGDCKVDAGKAQWYLDKYKEMKH
jgi:predicted  nucleic acid-binding Zn-ribbon protein